MTGNELDAVGIDTQLAQPSSKTLGSLGFLRSSLGFR